MQALWFSIRRFCNGYDIWLAFAGGALYCVFPAVYASSRISALAVALLCVLISRAVGTEFLRRMESPLWRRVLDIWLGVSSLLLMVGLGAAAGCVIRGAPPTGESRITDWFPVLCGACAVAVLTLQSAAWLALKSSGEWRTRYRDLSSQLWWAVVFCYGGVTAAGMAVQPGLLDHLQTYSWISVLAVVTLTGLMGMRLCLSVGFDLGTLAGAWCLIAGLVASVAAGTADFELRSRATWWALALLLAMFSVRWLHAAKPLADARASGTIR